MYYEHQSIKLSYQILELVCTTEKNTHPKEREYTFRIIITSNTQGREDPPQKSAIEKEN